MKMKRVKLPFLTSQECLLFLQIIPLWSVKIRENYFIISTRNRMPVCYYQTLKPSPLLKNVNTNTKTYFMYYLQFVSKNVGVPWG